MDLKYQIIPNPFKQARTTNYTFGLPKNNPYIAQPLQTIRKLNNSKYQDDSKHHKIV